MHSKFKIGHYTDRENITGCSVILCPPDTVASCYLAGSSPGSREVALLSPKKKINHIHALLLTGGSAFGLDAASGVVKFLEEQGIGYPTDYANVPLVPAAVIYDLNIGKANIRPNAENAYQACQQATTDFQSQGSVGAGTGATVGKWAGIATSMKGGLGFASVTLGSLEVCAVTVVNAVGDIVDEQGKIIAGAIDQDGKFMAREGIASRWKLPQVGFAENTVLCALMTNARLTKLEAHIMAHRAQQGLVRAIIPAGTSYDGDIIFSMASAEIDAQSEIVYELGTEAVRQSILSAVHHADALGGHLACKNLQES